MTLHFKPFEASLDDPTVVGAASQTKSNFYRSIVKTTFDVVLVLGAGLVVLPIILVMACLIALDGHNPFYSQLRVGKGGKNFRMWKMRTMVPNADAMLERYLDQNPEARAEWDRTQKLKKDPRITFVGRILRKTSLDELPQLFNILNGTMSLVGPRPMMVSQRDYYPGKAYYRLKPGITGFWQISDRNESSFVARVRYDEAYDTVVSLRTDIGVLFRTVGVVIRGTGY